jgi:tRNA pseudouridine13 synthase
MPADPDAGLTPCALGPPPASGRIRVEPEDFRVEEILGFDPDGAGAHALLTVQKRGANTGWVAARLARHAGVPPRDVGYSGHKDRHALTQQAFTLPLASATDVRDCLAWEGEGYRVVDAQRHGRKLRPGSHRGNRFELRVRGLAGERTAIERRLESIGATGVPNYFGPQRFGHGGANLRRAREWAAGGEAPRDRVQRSFALSAARSLCFNEVLASRVQRGDWNCLLPGEAVILDGKRSWFAAPVIDATLVERCASLDVHPSGPLPGRGPSPAAADAHEVEAVAVAAHLPLLMLLEQQGLDHERRSLRLPVRELRWSFPAGDELVLGFTLPRGTFATALLHELLVDAWDAGEGAEE